MGLIIESNDKRVVLFAGSYSEFDVFRRYIQSEFFKGKHLHNFTGCKAFFNHSDCDGQWRVSELKSILHLLQNINSNREWSDIFFQMIHGIRYCLQERKFAVFH
jgi:hypothetical protein